MKKLNVTIVGEDCLKASTLTLLHKFIVDHFKVNNGILFFKAANRCLEVIEVTYDSDTKHLIVVGKLSDYTKVYSPIVTTRPPTKQEIEDFERN